MMRLVLLIMSVSGLFAAPCVTGTRDCTEHVALGVEGRWTLVYRNFPLTVRSENITRALVVIHGQGRNADNYFASAMAAAFLAGALEDTLVVSPRIASNDGRACRDVFEPGEVNYRCSGDSWRSGAASVDEGRITSYDVTDQVLRLLAKKETFPNLKWIAVTGHSAGGQYVTRYAAANRVHDALGVKLEYFVADPSSYAYFDATRLPANASCNEKGDCTAEFGPYLDGGNCTTYDKWPYGLKGRTGGYTATLTDEDLKKQYTSRPVTYLLGELDTQPLAGFDSSCPAMAQGPNRLQRGLTYCSYMNKKFGAHHKVLVVPLCGHNARCIYTADVTLPLLWSALLAGGLLAFPRR